MYLKNTQLLLCLIDVSYVIKFDFSVSTVVRVRIRNISARGSSDALMYIDPLTRSIHTKSYKHFRRTYIRYQIISFAKQFSNRMFRTTFRSSGFNQVDLSVPTPRPALKYEWQITQ